MFNVQKRKKINDSSCLLIYNLNKYVTNIKYSNLKITYTDIISELKLILLTTLITIKILLMDKFIVKPNYTFGQNS